MSLLWEKKSSRVLLIKESVYMVIKAEKNKLWLCLLWILEGIVVGFGAILPGISGGTLCVAFGMYRPIIEAISDLKNGIKKHGLMLGVFLLGVAVGFVGLSGIAAILLESNTALVTCAFVGFILGTFPELWRDAGARGRGKGCYVSLVACFAVMLAVLVVLKSELSLIIVPDAWGFLLCGLLWGLSFIVPGLSSSSLLLFFGLYQPMLAGISGFDLKVLIPMGLGMLGCVLALSKAVGLAYKKHYSVISHGVLGIVAATAVMIFPLAGSPLEWTVNIFTVLCGAAISYALSELCNKLSKKVENNDN